jgi:CBS domain-containing protein
MEGNAIAGVLSERDCVRRIVLAGKSPDVTPIADVMVRNVVTVDLSGTFADCLKLMHEHRIRHLPVTDRGTAVTVISIRDLLSEAVAHHARIIGEMERERLSMTISTA